MDASLHTAVLNAALGAGVASVIVALIKRPTDKKANEIAANKLALEVEIATREQNRKDNQDLRDALKASQERLKAEQDRTTELEATADRLRSERNEAREQSNTVRESLALRVYTCNLIGAPCQMEKSPADRATDSTKGH